MSFWSNKNWSWHKKVITALFLPVAFTLLLPATSFAREGICGYEGGVSSGEAAGRSVYDYQEVSFVSGEPVVFTGTMTLKKQQKQGRTTTTYIYSLKNTEKSATLSRVLIFDTASVKADNGQVTETASFLKPASESIKIGGTTYTLKAANGYDLARSNLIDPKPAVYYHAGSIRSRKVYQVGAAANGDTVTVECTGRFYGYDQYWGNAESLMLDYEISGRKGAKGGDEWGGTATAEISSTSTEQLDYQKNDPDQISFAGGFVKSRRNIGILKYSAVLPEFDAKGNATDNMLTWHDSLLLESFPSQTSLPAPDLASIRGHAAEEDIRLMFGLGIFSGKGQDFKPDLSMSRAEFASAMVNIFQEVPQDPALATKSSVYTVKSGSSTARTGTLAAKTAAPASPFKDVPTSHPLFDRIKTAADRGLMQGDGNGMFSPDNTISKADALVTIIRALGFGSLGPSPVAVTRFRDNDLIPAYARNAAYTAQRIGLLSGDSKGNMDPAHKLTRAEGAALFKSLISYLQDGIRRDYADRLVNY